MSASVFVFLSPFCTLSPTRCRCRPYSQPVETTFRARGGPIRRWGRVSVSFMLREFALDATAGLLLFRHPSPLLYSLLVSPCISNNFPPLFIPLLRRYSVSPVYVPFCAQDGSMHLTRGPPESRGTPGLSPTIWMDGKGEADLQRDSGAGGMAGGDIDTGSALRADKTKTQQTQQRRRGAVNKVSFRMGE